MSTSAIEEHALMADVQVPRCHEYTKKGCLDSSDYVKCSMAIEYCEETIGGSFVSAGVNP
jgi:cathepsin A (carboxypeptidase C)